MTTSSSKPKIVHLTREIGLSGGGNAALSMISLIDELGYRQSVIHQSGEGINTQYSKSFKIPRGFIQNFLGFLERALFMRYPVRDDGTLISSGVLSMPQRRLKKTLSKLIRNEEHTFVICHWINLGFISLSTLNRISKMRKVSLVIHLHDLWFLQDLAHQPKYAGYGKVPQLPNWSLMSHPGLFQNIIQRKSRARKEKLRKRAIFSVSSKELLHYLETSPEYSDVSKELNFICIPMSLKYLLDGNLIKQEIAHKNFLLLIGNHSLRDRRKNLLSAINGYLISEIKNKYPLFVVCDFDSMTKEEIKFFKEKNVLFFDILDHSDALYVMSQSRVTIVPSTFETFGLTIFEASITAPLLGITSGAVSESLLSNLKMDFVSEDWDRAEAWDRLIEMDTSSLNFSQKNLKILLNREIEVSHQVQGALKVLGEMN